VYAREDDSHPQIQSFLIHKRSPFADPLALASGVTVTAQSEKSARAFAKIRNAPYGRHLDRRSIEQLWLDGQKTSEGHDLKEGDDLKVMSQGLDLSDAGSEYE
jgi:hypothetical protein